MLEEAVYEEGVPPWSLAAFATIVGGVESRHGIRVVKGDLGFDPVIALPALGAEWECEYFIDTGSRSARSSSGVAEGFVIKTSILARCWDSGRVRERVLYLKSQRFPGFFVAPGSDRQRQAATYIAEIASAAALAAGEVRPPEGFLDKWPRLVVRHGSILQQISIYTNEVFNLEERVARGLLLYSGLPRRIVDDLVEPARVEGGLVNSGLLAASVLGFLKESVGSEASVVGVTEDVSQGKHLALHALLEIIDVAEDETFMEYAREPLSRCDYECLYDVDQEARYQDWVSTGLRYSALLRKIIYEGLAGLRPEEYRTPTDMASSISHLKATDRRLLVKRAYESQVLSRYLGSASDAHLMLVYNYLYAEEPGLRATPRHSKSLLVTPLLEANIASKGLEERASVRTPEVLSWVDGVEYRYVMPEPAPPCSFLRRKARATGIDARLLAELVTVKPPLRLEYYSHDRRRDIVDARMMLSGEVTLYGSPSQLLVVDARSRVNEWDVGALRELLESQARRRMPYTSFIRDFPTRVRFVT